MTIANFHDKKLLDAAKSGHLVGVKSALAAGANPDLLDRATLMPLTHLCTSTNQFEMLRALLSAKATVSARDRDGRSLIRRCVEDGVPEAAKIAMGHGAELSEIDGIRDSLLHSACARGRRESKYFDIAKMLVDAGVDLKAKNERGETPLHHAARYGGARMARFVAGKSDMANADVDGHTPLHAAAMGIDNEDGVRAMLEAKGSVDARDREWRTPLHLIAAKTKTRPSDIGMARLILAAGANAWMRDLDGLTAYEVAASGYAQRREVHQELVHLLCPKGIEPPQPPPPERKGKGKGKA